MGPTPGGKRLGRRGAIRRGANPDGFSGAALRLSGRYYNTTGDPLAEYVVPAPFYSTSRQSNALRNPGTNSGTSTPMELRLNSVPFRECERS